MCHTHTLFNWKPLRDFGSEVNERATRSDERGLLTHSAGCRRRLDVIAFRATVRRSSRHQLRVKNDGASRGGYAYKRPLRCGRFGLYSSTSPPTIGALSKQTTDTIIHQIHAHTLRHNSSTSFEFTNNSPFSRVQYSPAASALRSRSIRACFGALVICM